MMKSHDGETTMQQTLSMSQVSHHAASTEKLPWMQPIILKRKKLPAVSGACAHSSRVGYIPPSAVSLENFREVLMPTFTHGLSVLRCSTHTREYTTYLFSGAPRQMQHSALNLQADCWSNKAISATWRKRHETFLSWNQRAEKVV